LLPQLLLAICLLLSGQPLSSTARACPRRVLLVMLKQGLCCCPTQLKHHICFI
jgi:hypothetical protein